MEFREVIKKFKNKGDYEITVSLAQLEKAINDYEEDYALELNPDFQRGHIWTLEQQIAFVEFFLRGGVTARTIYFNCPYFNDYKADKYDMNMVCMDGLQRLTALRKFIANELPVFGYYLKDFEDYKALLRIENLRININDLKTREEILEWYIDFNTGGTIHAESEIERVKKLLEEERKNK